MKKGDIRAGMAKESLHFLFWKNGRFEQGIQKGPTAE
jgi:hypothetical protein